VSLIEGDGIGPEISQAVKDIFEAAKVRIPCCDTVLDTADFTQGPRFLGARGRDTNPEGWQDCYSGRCDRKHPEKQGRVERTPRRKCSSEIAQPSLRR
jgi:isocitrate/isopropylmalate dehydrogenase